MVYQNIEELKKSINGKLKVENNKVIILDETELKNTLIDDLVFSAVFSPCPKTQTASRWLIRRSAAALGTNYASIQGLYAAMGKGEVSGFTVPAINIRGLTFDFACAVFRAAKKAKVGAVVLEIARSEMVYTKQSPDEYAVVTMAAAVKTGFSGAVFLQGDHFQISAKKYFSDSQKEEQTVCDLIKEAIRAGFYNIDIDTSTLVDLEKATIKEQQEKNYTLAAKLTAVVRDCEPKGVTVSVGGEIGEVGGKNSTVEEMRVFMDGYRESLDKLGKNMPGISKISVQTGTRHGGVPLTDGTIADVKLDFETLQKISLASRDEYNLSGAVQHGASTLPNEAFDRFPACSASEVHLATAFQNMIFESSHFPVSLRKKIYTYLKENFSAEKKAEDSEEQFLYKLRKKGFGPFKEELWNLPVENRRGIGKELEKQFTFLFEKLKVTNTAEIVREYVPLVDVTSPTPTSLLE